MQLVLWLLWPRWQQCDILFQIIPNVGIHSFPLSSIHLILILETSGSHPLQQLVNRTSTYVEILVHRLIILAWKLISRNLNIYIYIYIYIGRRTSPYGYLILYLWTNIPYHLLLWVDFPHTLCDFGLVNLFSVGIGSILIVTSRYWSWKYAI